MTFPATWMVSQGSEENGGSPGKFIKGNRFLAKNCQEFIGFVVFIKGGQLPFGKAPTMMFGQVFWGSYF